MTRQDPLQERVEHALVHRFSAPTDLTSYPTRAEVDMSSPAPWWTGGLVLLCGDRTPPSEHSAVFSLCLSLRMSDPKGFCIGGVDLIRPWQPEKTRESHIEAPQAVRWLFNCHVGWKWVSVCLPCFLKEQLLWDAAASKKITPPPRHIIHVFRWNIDQNKPVFKALQRKTLHLHSDVLFQAQSDKWEVCSAPAAKHISAGSIFADSDGQTLLFCSLRAACWCLVNRAAATTLDSEARGAGRGKKQSISSWKHRCVLQHGTILTRGSRAAASEQ